LQQQIKCRRHEHAAQGTRNGQRGHARIVQLAQDQLSLELQGDEEEKQRHQTVVDPVLQRTGELQRANPKTDRCLPQGQEWLSPRGIGEDQGSDGEQQ
jgi:hypothetical protein